MNTITEPAETALAHSGSLAVRHTETTEETRGDTLTDFLPQARPPTKRILLADDDASVRQMLGRVLESECYAVAFAKTGREAATKFASDPPDLVLLDLNMPDKDGWEAFGMMCSQHPMIPVVVITARPNQHPQAVELGVDALMEKPLHLPLLLRTMRNLLAETELQRTRRLAHPDFKTAHLKHRPERSTPNRNHEHLK